MKRILSIAPILLFYFFCNSQTSRIQQLESELNSASGKNRVQVLINLADANFESGLYAQAAERAEQAGDLAKKIRLPELRATALNREGKALMRAEKKGLFGKNKPLPRFTASNDILREIGSTNSALMLDNLENMKILAEKAGRGQVTAQIEAEIARVKGSGTLASADPGGSKTELKQEVSRLEQERAALDQKLQQQLVAANMASKKTEQLAREQQALKETLQAKEAAINQMNEEQIKAELILMQQRQMLDSLTFKSSLDSIQLLNKELAVREAHSSRNFYSAGVLALLLLLGGSTYSFFKARQHAKQIQAEQKRSEDLLLNILPALVARELKKQGYTDPQYHDSVAVLFADFVGFSKIAEQLSPADLIHELDVCFKAFDNIVHEFKLEKIKTVGDAYMAASGLDETGGNGYILSMVKAAQAMQNWLGAWNADRQRRHLPRFDARIGIHVGPVVAGVVGSKKFSFDIWGDTVNIAARVEQAGEGGKINISGKTYEQIKSDFRCSYRGEVEAKNKGKIEMYFVEN